MMGIYEQGLQTAVNRRMVDPRFVEVISQVLVKLQSGFFDQYYVDVIIQKFDRFPYSFYDAYAFAIVWSYINSGQVVLADIVVGSSPFRDRQIKENNEILSQIGFSAEFWGGTQDEDGFIEIDDPIYLDSLNRLTNERVEKKVNGEVFPLEVGYIGSEKTLVYLNLQKRLARWPYGHDCITLMKKVTPGSLSLPYCGRRISKKTTQLSFDLGQRNNK